MKNAILTEFDNVLENELKNLSGVRIFKEGLT